MESVAVKDESVAKRVKAGGEKENKRGDFEEIKRENALLADYYKRQELVPEEEWPVLMQTLGTALPTTFRLTGNRLEASSTLEQFKSFLPMLGDAAKELLWYEPAGYAWHLEIDRKSIRSEGRFAGLHRWMVAATENGDISRQEAVSMIPPLLLDIQPDHLVLDMCAAPGSKTAQLVEKMHSSDVPPTGLVIANDSDQQRAYMLYHQVKRILSPCLLVTNNDGTSFPVLVRKDFTFSLPSGEKEDSSSSVTITDETLSKRLFDRILADVPCSGDGTLRKNAMLWKTWNPNLALGLHPLQVRLLEKAIRLLKIGGKLVYSTCSMNFIENEAVIAHVLDKYSHSIRLVDVSSSLKGLERRSGRSTWKVITKEGNEFASFEDVPKEQQKRFPASIFPKTEYTKLNLDFAMRIYPHFQNTGGFFIALIEKIADVDIKSASVVSSESSEVVLDSENALVSSPAPVAAHKPRPSRFFKPSENEFRRLLQTDPVIENIFSWYGIDPIMFKNSGLGFFVRSERNPIKTMVVVSPTCSSILSATVRVHNSKEEKNQEGDNVDSNNEAVYNRSLKIVNAGVRAFEIYDTNHLQAELSMDCLYRPLFESISVLRPLMTKRIAQVTISEMTSLLKSQDSVRLSEIEAMLGEGGAIVETRSKSETFVISVPVWISKRGIKAFVSQVNKPALLLQLE